jgi:DNA gyrase subunit A
VNDIPDTPEPPATPGEFERIDIVDEMKTSYLDYAMSVIVSRALPDVRDGLKPVHRRILWACQEGGFVPGRAYRKSAKIVGDTMGNYHPHGNLAIYDALVRMAQWWSMRVPLIDGQGNFGSMDPDRAAAERYTEARLAKPAMALLEDIDKDTVDFVDNYDGSRREPSVVPARFPNLLVNGAGGIAVGMATNIPPHNLGEVIDGCLAMIDNPAITSEALIEFIPGPDFPTAPLILGSAGSRAAYTTGRGSILQRCRHTIEEGRGDRQSIVLVSIPYQVGRAGLVEKIAEAAKDKRIEGVSDIRDESNREGVRVVIDLKRDATPEVVLNQLWRHTPAQAGFPANMLAIRGGRPETLTLRDFIQAFIQFREEVITRRTKFELNKARDRAHILLGLVVAVSHLDEVVALIRGSSNPADARARLLAREWPTEEIQPYLTLVEAVEPDLGASEGTYRLSEAQVKAILDLRLHRLTALGRDEIGDELKELATKITEYLAILADRARLYEVMREELAAVRDAFATPRVSEIAPAWDGIEDEDLIERDEMVVTVTLDGYIKRTPLSTFRAQNRGGKGRAGWRPKEEDAVSEMFVTSTHNPVLFFSTAGKVYRLKVWRLPEGGANTRGRPIVNLLPALDPGETIATVLPLPEDEDSWGALNVVFATAKGRARRNSMDAFANIPRGGKFAMRFDEDSEDRLDRRGAVAGGRRCPARQPAWQGDPLRCRRYPRVPEPHVDGRAGDEPQDRRRGRLAVDPPSGRRQGPGGARRLPALRAVEGREGRRAADDRRALRGARGEGAVHPHRLRQRLRQAQLGLRVPPHRARRPGHHQHRQHRQERPGRGELHRDHRRPAHAGDRPGQADPYRTRFAARDRPRFGGGAAVQRRRRRAHRQRGAARRAGRARERGRGSDRRGDGRPGQPGDPAGGHARPGRGSRRGGRVSSRFGP